MTKKLLKMGVVFIMFLGLFSGCGRNKYNAELHYNAQALMNTDFLAANITLGAEVNMVEDTTSPPTRTHIIKDKSNFDLAFYDFPQEIDFSKKMVLVHFFTSSYPISPYKLGDINLTENSLSIEFKLNKSGSYSSPDAARPQQSCIVILIDKIDINTVTFIQK